VIYLHGNSSSRIEALECINYLLSQNITLFCFDFAACGLSEGEYISLGWYEREDLAIIVEHLRLHRRVSTIGLWGRSMGAVTALLYADRDPSIAGMVLDSPFTNLKVLVNELAKHYTKMPSILVSGAIKLIRKTIQSKA
jgi:alpha-beta hydrolase superfamily lysophospholipase